MISFIWIENLNGVIGADNKLPWKLPADMKYFKETTMGHPIIAGGKTYRSYNRPLPGRLNIVLSKQNDFPKEVIVMHSADELKEFIQKNNQEEYFVIGGAEVFNHFLSQVDKLYRTVIETKSNGDTYMPKIDYDKFELLNTVIGKVDEENRFPYRFEVYQRI